MAGHFFQIMAGDWIKMNKSLVRDPRVIRISSALKADRLRTIGGLFSAWCLFDEQTEDGSLPGYSPEIMDELVGMPGLSLAMESVGWMTIGDEFIAAPRFDEHNGASAKRRAQDCVRKKSARQADKHPQPQRTDCGPEKRREEKRRVEDEEQQHRPPNFEQVSGFAKSQPFGIPDPCIDAFFDEMEALQWTYKGQPCIAPQAWQARFRRFATAWINNDANPNRAAK